MGPRRDRIRSWQHSRGLAEVDSQLAQSEPHPALDRARGQAESGRDLGVGEAAEVGQLDHLPLVVGKAVQRAADEPRVAAALDLVLGALARGQGLADPVVRYVVARARQLA